MDDLECDAIEKVAELLKAPRNIQDSVWDIWTMTGKAATLVVEKWTFYLFYHDRHQGFKEIIIRSGKMA